MLIEKYNNLVDTMNNLLENGNKIYNFCDSYSGYGFYLEINKEYYVKCLVFEKEYTLSLRKHNSKYMFDTLNDIRIGNSIEIKDYKLVEKEILKLIEKAKEINE